MKREHLADLAAFVTVARELSFTRAASKLGITQSSLSHAIRRLESRLGLRLLSRTTCSVAPTQAGERLLRTLRPAFEQIDTELDSLTALREKPAGSIRITTAEHAADTVLLPGLERFLPEYPDIHVEVTLDYGLTQDHGCINLRLPTRGGIYAWEFEKGTREVNVRVDGQLAFNTLSTRLRAARAGLGIAFVPGDVVQADIAAGRLVRVLADWCAPFPGYHLYYPSRRHATPAFALLVEALRFHGEGKVRGK